MPLQKNNPHFPYSTPVLKPLKARHFHTASIEPILKTTTSYTSLIASSKIERKIITCKLYYLNPMSPRCQRPQNYFTPLSWSLVTPLQSVFISDIASQQILTVYMYIFSAARRICKWISTHPLFSILHRREIRRHAMWWWESRALF